MFALIVRGDVAMFFIIIFGFFSNHFKAIKINKQINTTNPKEYQIRGGKNYDIHEKYLRQRKQLEKLATQ